MKKILFITGKWPYKSSINDGGDAVVSEMIEALGKSSLLTLLVVKNDIDETIKIPDVCSVIKLNQDVSCFNNYGKQEDSKFFKWMKTGEYIAEYLRNYADNYDLIIIHHILFSLGLTENDDAILQKSILMPMFTGISYRQAGEYVPELYLETERRILPHAGYILTPSNLEKNLLIQEYAVADEKISVIPRPVKFDFIRKTIADASNIRLLYIGSVRKQKNHAGAVTMMKYLTEYCPDAKLICCGAIQENSLYEECQSLISKWGLEKNIEFLGNCSREELSRIIRTCDINISVSNSETFGRGIYEGMAAGLPTVVLNRLECVRTADTISVCPVIASDYAEMAYKIQELITHPAEYLLESKKGEILQKELSSEKIYTLIRKAVLYRRS